MAAWPFLFLAAESSTGKFNPHATLKLPPLQPLDKSKTYQLRVGIVESPSFHRLTKIEMDEMFSIIEKITWTRLQYKVKLIKVWNQKTDDFYKKYEKLQQIPIIQSMLGNDLQLHSETGRDYLNDYIYNLFDQHGQKTFKQYLRNTPRRVNPQGFSNALENQFYNFHNYFLSSRKENDPDTPIYIPENLAHSFWMNSAILHHIKDADLIFLNHILCKPDKQMPIYQIARGGLLTGAVDDNLHNELRGASFISIYPFFPQDKELQKLNGPIPENKRHVVAAFYTVHELGHLLDRRKEVYDHDHCISKATTTLNYYAWYKNVENNFCRKHHEKITTEF